ncbi:uncharacterized protein [Nicotiana sylvestris]|uniref:Uncharacterized protein LOC104219781 n=1 Tax=Nicotiana sylvestris TaxID=4096 RepID=A0A1U7VQX6_NICSY|nr:PREDICTED: uncharacterized protein LOC104219781 [Nicotiana sylvestris]
MVEAWLILGDFNTVLSINDRINGNHVSQSEVVDFQACVEDTGMGLLNRKGCQWSWCNKRDVTDRIYNNINWSLENSYWFMQYSYVEAVYDNYGVSDHSPILLCTKVTRNYLPKPFRPLIVLLHEEEFSKIVQEVWAQKITGYTMYLVWQKLQILGSRAKGMNKAYNSVDKKIEILKDHLQKVQKGIDNDMFNNTLILEEKELLMQVEK